MKIQNIRPLIQEDAPLVNRTLLWAFRWRENDATAPPDTPPPLRQQEAGIPPELLYLSEDWMLRGEEFAGPDLGFAAFAPAETEPRVSTPASTPAGLEAGHPLRDSGAAPAATADNESPASASAEVDDGAFLPSDSRGIEAGAFLGAVLLRFWKEDYHSFGYLSADVPELNIAVSPEARGRGVGRLLLRQALDEVRRRALDGELPRAAVSLSVEGDNRRARKLYLDEGFVVLEERENDILMGWTAPWSLREMEKADIESVLNLWRESDGIGLYEDQEDSPEGISEFLDRNPGLGFVAVCAGKVIGAVICGFDGRRGYVHHLAVRTEFRGSGAGKSLLKAVSAALADRGVRKMHLFVLGDNERAIEFYRRIGWSERDDLVMFSLNTSR